jgi:predicted nuclease with RNAse H fold
MVMMEASAVAGIDIGGDKKGFHLVILRGTRILCNIRSRIPEHLLQTCVDFNVVAVGIDAPCQWGIEAEGRLAEKQLAQGGVFCFATPTRERAVSSASGFYGWMLNGERVYRTFATAYPLPTSKEYSGGRVSFETFPHAITCAVLGKEAASARKKRVQRRELLALSGIDGTDLKSIDAVDAALCALAAGCLLAGRSRSYGDAAGGYIRVPASNAGV